MLRSRYGLTIAAGILFSSLAAAQEVRTVFRGRPEVKVTTAATGSTAENVLRSDASNLECVISLIGDRIYWASRENKPLSVHEKGAFLVFVAEGGAGYIKVIKPDMKQAASLFGESEQKYDYVEHMTLGLNSISYYGTFAP